MTGLQLYLIVPLAPLAGALIAGLGGRRIGRAGAHWVTIIGVAISLAVSCLIFRDVLDGTVFNGPVYTWLVSDGTRFEIGFLIDRLSALMMVVVTFVSLMVHIYTIGYMADDPGYQRFFAYIALFTFSMLILVMANNFLQLFFGWEAVGLVSYLLIGFWYTRPSAIYANLKAFLVNRVGDFGFLLAIALVLAYFGTLDYAAVFSRAPSMAGATIEAIPGAPWLLLSAICIGLFVGAMGKSAQFPLHVWLPDSMEGPTPISALIHAATMVTAGIFMVARMSPLFEHSQTALSFVLVIGGITAFFMALIAVVQYDIKRVVAYSTLSQLGYMTVALGASAYSAAIFHLMTHAFFKALLFLGAGSVIIALHHEQDMRKMGGLRKYMPWTYATVLIGAIASAGVPGFAGFFSKDAIIEAVHLSKTPGAGFAWLAVTACVFVTAFYTFRLLFYAFHGKERFESHGHGHGDHHSHAPHESPAVVTVPLVLLAIPSICAGWLIGPVLFGGYFGESISIAPSHPGLREMAEEFHGVLPMMAHALKTVPFWLTVAGIAAAWYLYILRPELPAKLRNRAGLLVTILEEKYGFDRFNDWFFAGGARKLGSGLWRFGDVAVIDGLMVNGSARLIGWFAGVVRLIQSGYIYQYAFFMIIGVSVLLTYFIFFRGTLVR
ncbi:MAG TPA: NADH-quinone oxidoreductase subunit L [Burkholderiales bacterium]|nr:NADH-quinone oxidoreductase subunit L [Burkholderiales bacterium]